MKIIATPLTEKQESAFLKYKNCHSFMVKLPEASKAVLILN